MSDNWVVSTLENALSNWNEYLAEIWSLVSQTPESFRGGEIWTVIVSIHNALVGFGYGLLVLFFCNGRIPLGGQLPRTAKAGICFTAFYPVSACKGGGRLVVEADNRDLQNLRRRGQHRHGRHRCVNLYDGNLARQNCRSH